MSIQGLLSGSFMKCSVIRGSLMLTVLHICPGKVSTDTEFSLQLLHAALSVNVQEAASSPHWVLDCSPFPLLYVLAQLYNQTLRYVVCSEHPHSKIFCTVVTIFLFFSEPLCQMLDAATRGRCPPLFHGHQRAAGVRVGRARAGSGGGGGRSPQQLVQSSVLAPQQGGGTGLDGPLSSEACVGTAL